MARITAQNYQSYMKGSNRHIDTHTREMYLGDSPTVQAGYGTYDSVETAHKVACYMFSLDDSATATTPCTDIPRGFTVAVETNNSVIEYQYKKPMPVAGYTAADLEVKSIANVDASDVSYGNSNVGTALLGIEENIHNLKDDAGTISGLETTYKQDLVGAVNEVNTKANSANTKIGTLTSLHTTDKTTVVDAINEVKDAIPTSMSAENVTYSPSGSHTAGSIAEAVASETTRAQAAEADRYTKSETYTKEEVHNLITTPNQEYVSVTATALTTAVTDVLPVTGAADTTYRVGNWDGTQYNDSVFSEYAWNGSVYIKLSTKSQIGEVYDISANHANTKYADLVTALGTNGANVPSTIRKGGMSIKFINSTTNKYEQWNLKASSWSINTSNWTLDVDGSVTNGKLKLPFELEKPSSNKYVTRASEIGHNGQPLGQVVDFLQNIIRNFFIDDASGDICFADGNGNIVFRLCANGVEARQFRVLNSSGELVGTIDSAFLSDVLKSSDIIDNLTSSATNKPLSAKQGSVLKGLIDELMSSMSLLKMFIDDESGNTCFVDNNGNIVFRLSTNGVDMRKLNILSSDGSLVGTIDKNFFDYIASLEGLQSIAENVLVDDSGNTYFADERGNVALKIASDGSVDFKALGNNLKRAVKEEYGDSGVKTIRCWGDSLTMGAGKDNAYNKDKVVAALVAMGYTDVFTNVPNIDYPKMMQLLLGNIDYEVINHGVGGESINTIAARQGAYNAMISQDVTIPATKTPVLLGNDNLLSTFYYMKGQTLIYYGVKPLLQGIDNSVNPITIEGIEGTLSVTYDSGYTNVKYYFTRSEVGRETVIPQHSSIIMKGSALSPHAHASIIWCWQNGGFFNLTELKKKLHQYIEKLNTSYYVIVGLHTGDATSREEQERELEREFGDRFFNWRRYVSTNALYDFGITPTTDEDLTQEQIDHNVKSDTYQMSIGALPSALWRSVYGINGASSNDYVHLNSAGYMILGYKLVERLKLLGAL